jgi:hypothetical protein
MSNNALLTYNLLVDGQVDRYRKRRPINIFKDTR